MCVCIYLNTIFLRLCIFERQLCLQVHDGQKFHFKDSHVADSEHSHGFLFRLALKCHTDITRSDNIDMNENVSIYEGGIFCKNK